jgi:cation transport ATPase
MKGEDLADYELSRPREKLRHILLEIFVLKFPGVAIYANKGVKIMGKTFQIMRMVVVFVTMCFAMYGLLTEGANATFALKVAAILAIILGTHTLGEIAHAASESELRPLDFPSERRMLADQKDKSRIMPREHGVELEEMPVQVAS